MSPSRPTRARAPEPPSPAPRGRAAIGPTRARAEWDPLEEVLIHRPGVEVFFGLLEPYSFLYERAFRADEARYEHEGLEHALRDAGVEVRRLLHLAIEIGARHPELVEQVRALVPGIVHYSGPRALVERARQALTRNLETFDGETLFHILLLRPSVRLARRAGHRARLPRIELDSPLANLYFLRDQQALTARGYVLGRMAKPQRRHEPALTGALLRAWGAEIAGSIRAPGTFEGGDFLPLGEVALLGTGDRTNASAVRQILALDLGVGEIAVVHQPSHPAVPGGRPDPMINMHLDTYLNIAGEGLAVGCPPLLDRARTEVYTRRAGGWSRAPKTLSLSEYLARRRIEVVPITSLEQMCYASNFLCLRDRRILAVEVEPEVDRVLAGLARAAQREPTRYGPLLALARRERESLATGRGFFPRIPELRDRGVEVRALRLGEVTGGYGGAHCMTGVLRRRAPAGAGA